MHLLHHPSNLHLRLQTLNTLDQGSFEWSVHLILPTRSCPAGDRSGSSTSGSSSSAFSRCPSAPTEPPRFVADQAALQILGPAKHCSEPFSAMSGRLKSEQKQLINVAASTLSLGCAVAAGIERSQGSKDLSIPLYSSKVAKPTEALALVWSSSSNHEQI